MWQPGWEGSLRENGYMHKYGWVSCCSPETVTTLLISYTPIHNKSFKKVGKKIKNLELFGGGSFEMWDRCEWECSQLMEKTGLHGDKLNGRRKGGAGVLGFSRFCSPAAAPSVVGWETFLSELLWLHFWHLQPSVLTHRNKTVSSHFTGLELLVLKTPNWS